MLLITDERLLNFSALVNQQKIERLKQQNLACEGNIQDCKITLVDGKKYIKVNRGSRGTYGMFMIDKDSEIIYGIKGYGQVNKQHAYGTLSTTNEFHWGDYTPSRNR